MINTFLRSFISFFLVLLIFVNIVYYFNMVSLMPMLNNVDVSNKYFGVSTLIDVIKGMQNRFTFMNDFQNFLNQMSNKAYQLVVGNWQDFTSNQGGISDLKTFFQAIGLFFQSIGGVLIYIFYLSMFSLYALLMLVNAMVMLFYFLFSGAVKTLPSTYGTWNTFIVSVY